MTARLDLKSTTVSLDIRVPLTLKIQIQKEANLAGLTMSEYIRNKLQEMVK